MPHRTRRRTSTELKRVALTLIHRVASREMWSPRERDLHEICTGWDLALSVKWKQPEEHAVSHVEES